ncbi:MAG TPA: hypothetical protein VFE98_02665, partial [Candidatus Bathyarchaeia archaeon]|nr:hypothetical protein [Candidatus Bathyarchaeia archaeon]
MRKGSSLMYPSLVRHAKAAWKIFERLARESFVLRPSMPILYFGDSPRYFQSERKVVTVGLNPSFNEFQNERGMLDIGFRFPLAPNMLANTTKEQDYENYLQSLNRYFETNPYWRWFRSLVPILNAL